MDLSELREQIDSIDAEILRLFERRMDIVQNVAEYKRTNQLPVFQSGREQEIITRIGETAAPLYGQAAQVLFTAMMDISKCLQKDRLTSPQAFLENFCADSFDTFPSGRVLVACPGTDGSFSHIAAQQLFPEGTFHFYTDFPDVFRAVENGDADFGVLPIENSNAGSVLTVYDQLSRSPLYICRGTKIKIEHCLAARPGVSFEEIEQVYSHPQAISQCYDFLHEHQLKPCEYSNTAAAASMVSQSMKPLAAICSETGARQHGLSVLRRGIQNNDQNYTRFICVSKHVYTGADADTTSVSFRLPNTAGSLYRMLTKVAARGINMTKIESSPAHTEHFDVIFYVNFAGNLTQENILCLLNDLAGEISEFKFLGNYLEVLSCGSQPGLPEVSLPGA
ncbi:MAG TPA: chorismate mutase [Firmicutes bacterium]|nr:chorismate mutase [Bacillota bacterium]